jgi:hypothetical protein
LNESLRHCGEASKGVHYDVRWFVEPLGYAEVSRAIQGGRKRRGVDMLKVVQSEGFAAIQGVGGHVFFATDAGGLVTKDRPEILHRTFVYAPAVKRAAGDKSKDKYDLAMRMLDFPNSSAPDALKPQAWTLPDVASYLSCNWKMRQAFDYSETLVDALADDKGAFKEMWQAKKSGMEGPEIDIYKDLLDYLGTRATVLADIKLPVTTKSERLLMLFELKSPASTAAVAKTLEKNYRADPEVRRRDFEGQVIWDVKRQLTSDEPTKSKGKAKAKAKDENIEVAYRNLAVTAYLGHLIVSTHRDFVEEFIAHQKKPSDLAREADYQRVAAVLPPLGAKLDSFHYFCRTDESYRANYELFQQGKLPVAETLLAQILNEMLSSSEGGPRRKQEFDGSKLPNFDSIKKYLGPGGLFAQTENDGWWLVGCLLKKQ